MAEEPSLPPLPAVSWNEDTQSFSNNPRKRVRARRSSNAGLLFGNSSDPAIFSSDDDPALDNYVEGRRKRRYIGSWFQQQPVSDSSMPDSSTEESRPLPKPKRTLRRQLDSGVWMGSDSTDGDDDFMDMLQIPAQPRLPQLQRPPIRRPVISPAEQLARERIQMCLDEGSEDVDLSSMGLESLSTETIVPLGELTYIPVVAEGVPFEHRDPWLRLFLSGNPLCRVPGAIFDLQNLTVLSLRSCGLRQLPPAIGKLKRLETLNLAQNELRQLPAELLDLMAAPGTLKNLFLQGNKFYQASRLPAQVDSDSHLSQQPGANSGATVVSLSECDGSGSYEQHLVQKLPSTFEGVAARYMARSAIEYSNSAGATCSKFRLHGGMAEPVEVDADQTNSDPSCPPSFSAEATRVPSLFELAARSCYRSPDLEELTQYVPDTLPQVRGVLDRAVEQRRVGGYSCWRCEKLLVTPATRWLEWWQVARVRRHPNAAGSGTAVHFSPWSDTVEEQAVPFMRMGCSWKCVPGRVEPGIWAIRGEEEA
ncbi:hypothetical protein ACRALDRAFT_1079810 [Sodiomyces alcalophilus JCM 7366]|uniref:uncharacterized protein n=1 Tax=Sodiomyces alcalophilus JCM 7366 TaxID=591952 RepID=UPI0039B3663C